MTSSPATPRAPRAAAEQPATPRRTTLSDLVRAQDRWFLLLGLGGRLPNAMLPLGLLLHVSASTGSFAQGGLTVAALSVGGGVGGPVVGACADRFGHRVTTLVAAAVGVVALAAFLLVTAATESLPLTLLLAGLVGLGNPQVGSMARSRWAALARDREDRGTFTTTAMAYEGAVDEVSFVLGPVLVSTVAGLVSPTVGLLLALAIAAVAQVGFALHHSALPGRGRVVRRRDGSAAPPPLLLLGGLLLATWGVGLVFGSSSTGVASTLTEAGRDELTGAVYAALGLGAAVAGLLTTRLPHGFGLPARIVVGGAGLVLAGLLLSSAGSAGSAGSESAASSPWTLAAACLVAGLAVAPVLVSAYSLAEAAAPAGWSATTMTALATANVVGVAAGAAVAGQLVDRVAPSAALLVVSGAGVLVVLGGALTHRRRAG